MRTARNPDAAPQARTSYAVRDANGRFKDIHTYKRAQGRDSKWKAQATELARPGGAGAERRRPNGGPGVVDQTVSDANVAEGDVWVGESRRAS
jgi:hypothetical protein